MHTFMYELIEMIPKHTEAVARRRQRRNLPLFFCVSLCRRHVKVKGTRIQWRGEKTKPHHTGSLLAWVRTFSCIACVLVELGPQYGRSQVSKLVDERQNMSLLP